MDFINEKMILTEIRNLTNNVEFIAIIKFIQTLKYY